MFRDIVNRFLHSRGCVFLIAAITVVTSLVAYDADIHRAADVDSGFALISPDSWIHPGVISLLTNVALNILISFLLITINKAYNTMRSLSSMAASVFLVMQIGSPASLIEFNGSTLMAIGLIATTFLLFSVYQNPANPRRIFLIFFLIATGALTLYSFLFYIPLFFLGMAQMRVFTFRCVCAALLGLITPLWILMGFGIITPSDFILPSIISIFSLYTTPVLLILFVTTLLTLLLGVMFIMLNFIKMLTYNSRIRAANGFLTSLLIASMIFCIVDFNNAMVYLTTINWLTAYQIGHYFATSGQRRSYIGVATIMIAYATLYAWNLSL